MKHAVAVRIEYNDIALLKLSTGIIITRQDLFMDIMFNHVEYTIQTNNGIGKIALNKDGETIDHPPLKELSSIDIL